MCLQSPLVSRRHALVRITDGKLHLENVGLNSCMVGDEEVLGGQSAVFEPGAKVRIWPYTLTFEAEKAATVARGELEAHLRSIMAELELRIHRKLLERLDLYEFETNQVGDTESILLLENNIEDVCRDLRVFAADNEPLLEEITGLTLRDHLVNQLIMETGTEEYFDLASLTSNEFDVPATLVPEREVELHALLQFIRERVHLEECRDVTEQVERVETRFNDVFHLVRPHLHAELRKYLILRTLKKDLKDTIFGFGPLQDLLRAPAVTEIMVVASDLIYVERGGMIEKSGRRFISDKVTESIIERIVAQVGRRIDKSQPLVDARLPDGSRVNAIIPPLGLQGSDADDPQIPRPAADDGRSGRYELHQHVGGHVPAGLRDRPAKHPGKRRHRHRQDDALEHPEQLHSLQRAHRHDRRHHRVADAPGARRHAGNEAAQYRGRRRIHGPRPGEERPAHAARSDHRGRVPRTGSARHDPGHEHGPRRLDDHGPRQQRPGSDRAAGGAWCSMAADLPVSSIHRQLASALDLIVHISRLPGGARVITQVTEVLRYDPDENQMILHDIFNFRNGESLRRDRLSAVVCRFAGGEGIARPGVPLRSRGRRRAGDRLGPAAVENWKVRIHGV